MTLDTALPYEPEMENSLLGYMMDRPDYISEMLSRLPAEAFYHPANKQIYVEMVAMSSADQNINMSSLTSWLRDRGMLDKVGGLGKVSELFQDRLLSPSVRDEMIEKILAKRKLRDGIVAVSNALQTVTNPEYQFDPNLWVSSVIESLSGIQADISGKKHKGLKDLVIDATNRYEEAALSGGRLAGVSTGFRVLDSFTGGLRRGQMWVLSGGTSDGKSAYTGQILLNVARGGVQCCLYSLEMSAEENVDRFFANVSEVSSSKFLSGLFNRDDSKRFTEASRVLSSLPLHVRDVSGIKLSPLLADMRYMKHRHGVQVFAVDYGQLVDADKPEHSREREVAIVSKAFKDASKSLDCCILVMSQVNDDGRLRESRSIGHDAHVVGSLTVPLNDNGERLEEQRILQLPKNRNGPRWKKIRYNFRGETFAFNELGEVAKEDKPAGPKKRGAHFNRGGE